MTYRGERTRTRLVKLKYQCGDAACDDEGCISGMHLARTVLQQSSWRSRLSKLAPRRGADVRRIVSM